MNDKRRQVRRINGRLGIHVEKRVRARRQHNVFPVEFEHIKPGEYKAIAAELEAAPITRRVA